MPITYRRPGVYLEESLLVTRADVVGTVTVACFVGVTGMGPINEPYLVQTWSDYVTVFGGFGVITPPAQDPNNVTSRLGGATFTNLATLKADPTTGDKRYTGAPFTAGQYVILDDATKNHYALPALSTNKGAAAPGQDFAAEATVTAEDQTNADKLTGLGYVASPNTAWTAGQFIGLGPQPNYYRFVWGRLNYNVTNKALTSNVATLTLGTHALKVGDSITVAGVDAVFDGTVTITAIAASTISYAKTNANIASTPSSGTVQSALRWISAPSGTPANNGAWAASPFPGTAEPIPQPTPLLSYMPYSVYSFFQNGGRFAWILRVAPSDALNRGTRAVTTVNGSDVTGNPLTSFRIQARSAGEWGNRISYELFRQSTVEVEPGKFEDVFAINVWATDKSGHAEVVERYRDMSMTGQIAGTKRVDARINDPNTGTGSTYIDITDVNYNQRQPVQATTAVKLSGGVDPGVPDAGALASAVELLTSTEGPINLNIVGYLSDAAKVGTDAAVDVWVSTTVPSSVFADREDVFIVNDSAPPRPIGTSSAAYASQISSTLGTNLGDPYSASYTPWLIVPDPQEAGQTIQIPPGGAVLGVISRIDATTGVFRAPAGVVAGIANAVGVQTKYTDSEQGNLNAANINVIRSVVGAGICIMGARTRKTYGVDRYISARRTLIYIKESLRRSTQYAVFENNDERLWSSLRTTAERILTPLWELGGLRGSTSAEAFFVRCDETINTDAVIQSGEVRMEVGVALEYPAEFVIIKITQFEQGSFSSEVQPVG